MVIKTELCAYSQWKIYPGHGQRFVDKDGKSSLFLYKRSRIFALRFNICNTERLKLKNLDGQQLGEDLIERLKKMMLEKRRRRESSREKSY
jgi:hypothetical protein